jgi:ligand-binding sensor domain-containing protein/two-component sensor histidine kinase
MVSFKRSIYILFVTILWSGLSPVFGQIPDMMFSNITVDDGLPQNSVLDIVQDSLGFIWLASPRSLSRFDGKDFKIFDKLFDNPYNPEGFRNGQLLVHEHYLWLITKGGKVEIMDLETEKFISVSSFGGNNSVAFPRITTIFIENSNRIWLGTENEGVYLVNQDFEVVNHYHINAMPGLKIVSNRINKISKDSSGNIWVLTDSGLNRISNSEVYTYLKEINVTSITENPEKGVLYLGTYGLGVYGYIFKTDKVNKIYTRNSGMLPADLFVTDLIVDKDNMLWIGTRGNGIFIFNGFFSEAKQYHFKRGDKSPLRNTDVTTLFLSKSEAVYFGTDGGGVGVFDPYLINFRNLTEYIEVDELPEESATAITMDQTGLLWYGTSGRKFVSIDYRNKFATVYDLKDYFPGIKKQERIKALQFDADGDLWLGTEGEGILVFNLKAGALVGLIHEGLPADIPKDISSLLLEDSTSIWAGTSVGLFLINKNSGIVKHLESLPEDRILSLLHIDKKTLAIGYENLGIWLMDKISGKATPLYVEKEFSSFLCSPINALYYLNGYLWAATSGSGIVTINLETGGKKKFTINEGLQDNYVFGISAENSRVLWFSTGKGIIRLIYKKENQDLKIEKLSFYNRQNGLYNNEFTPGSFFSGSIGDNFFGGINGISYFRPDEIEIKESQVTLVISEAKINHQPLKQNLAVPYLKHIELDHFQNSVELKFIGLNTMFSSGLNYSYKLIGYDDDWVEAGGRNFAVYTNLDPGNYTFSVRLAQDGLDAVSFTSLGILIRAPYWKTTWFKTLLFLMVFFILWVFYKVRIYQLLQVQKIKDNISADLHDDLGASLTSIQMIWAVTKNRLGYQNELKDVIQLFDEKIHESSEALDEIVGNMRLKDENLSEVVSNTRRYVSDLLESQGIVYQIHTDFDLGNRQLSMQKRRDFFLICKELLNNIIKHAQAEYVHLSVMAKKDHLVLFVEDNGIGFNSEQQRKRHGLSIIKKRINKWKGNFHLESVLGKGTRITIEIPFDSHNIYQKLMQIFQK